MKYIIGLLLFSISLFANESELQTKFIWSGNQHKLEKEVNDTLIMLQNANKNIKEIKMSCTMSGGLVMIVYENNNMEEK